MVSSDKVAIAGGQGGIFTSPNIISSNTPFDLNSAYITAAWNNNLSVTMTGYVGAVQTYSSNFLVSASAATLFNFDWFGVTEVTIFASGGTNAGLSGNGTQLVFDNITINETPIPSTLPLFATGLGALSLLGWRRKRKAARPN